MKDIYFPLGTPPNQELSTTEDDLINHSIAYFELVQLPQEERTKIEFRPISNSFLPKYIEQIFPGAAVPDKLLKSFGTDKLALFRLQYPGLRDDVILGFNNNDELNLDSALFSIHLSREVARMNIGKSKDCLINSRFDIKGIVRDSFLNERLLSLSYDTWMNKDFRLQEAIMSLQSHESNKFFENADRYVRNSADNIFTPRMRGRVIYEKAVSFKAESSTSKRYLHPKESGTFLQIQGKEVLFGLNLFRRETPTIRVPLTLRKPRELRISL